MENTSDFQTDTEKWVEELEHKLQDLHDPEERYEIITSHLSDIEDVNNRKYELRITRLVGYMGNDFIDDLIKLLTALQENDFHLRSQSNSETSPDKKLIEFTIFFAINKGLNRENNIHELDRLYREMGERINKKPKEYFDRFRGMFEHLQSIRADKRGLSGNPKQFIEGLYHAENAIQEAPTDANGNILHAGISHNWAVSAAWILQHDLFHEVDLSRVKLSEKNNNRDEKQNFIETALEYANQALNTMLTTYGRFYVTLGILQAEKGELDKGEENIRAGINYEDPDDENYGIRVTKYQHQLSIIDLKREKQKLIEHAEQEIKKTTNKFSDQFNQMLENVQNRIDQLEEEQTQILFTVLEFIGFFSGLMALVFSSTQIAMKLPFQQSARIIVIMTGGLITAFGTFGLIVSELQFSLLRTASKFSMVLIGIGLMIGGFFL